MWFNSSEFDSEKGDTSSHLVLSSEGDIHFWFPAVIYSFFSSLSLSLVFFRHIFLWSFPYFFLSLSCIVRRHHAEWKGAGARDRDPTTREEDDEEDGEEDQVEEPKKFVGTATAAAATTPGQGGTWPAAAPIHPDRAYLRNGPPLWPVPTSCVTHTHTHTHITHTPARLAASADAQRAAARLHLPSEGRLFFFLFFFFFLVFCLYCVSVSYFSRAVVCVCVTLLIRRPWLDPTPFDSVTARVLPGFFSFGRMAKAEGGGGEGIDSCISFSTHHWSGFYCLLLVASLRYILHFQLTRNCFVWIHWMDWTTSSIKGTSYGDGWFDLLSSFQLTYGITILRLTPKSSIEFPFTRPSLYFLLLYRVNWSDTPLILVDNIILPLVTKKSLMGTSFFYRVVSGSGGLGSDSAAGRVEFKTCEVRIQLEMFHSEVLISGPILRQSRMS